MPRIIPIALQPHIAGGSTTLCMLIKITPVQPGVEAFGITTLDVDVHYDDGTGPLLYSAAIGAEPSTLQASSDLSVAGGESKQLMPVFDTPISEQALAAGACDYAKFVAYLVNYNDLTSGNHILVQSGTTGRNSPTDSGLAWTAEFRGLTQALKQSITEKYSLSCRSIFGSTGPTFSSLAEDFSEGLVHYTNTHGNTSLFSLVDSPYGKALSMASQHAVDSAFIQRVFGPMNGDSLSFYFKMSAIEDDDAGILILRDWQDTPLFSFNPAREAAFSGDRAPSVQWGGTVTVLPHELTAGVWYFFEFFSQGGDMKVRLTNMSDATFTITTVGPDGSMTVNFMEFNIDSGGVTSPTEYANILFSATDHTTATGLASSRYPCNFDVSTLWSSGTVESVGIDNTQEFATSGLTVPYGGAPGLVQWLTGANAGRSDETETFDQLVGPGAVPQTIGLTFGASYPIQVGDTFRYRDDCPKTPEACKARNNFPNYRGEPTIPVSDSGVVAVGNVGSIVSASTTLP